MGFLFVRAGRPGGVQQLEVQRLARGDPGPAVGRCGARALAGVVPFGVTFQPCAVSRAVAVDGE